MGRPRAPAVVLDGGGGRPWRRDGTQPRFRRRRAPCQLAVRRRTPPPSNSSASAVAPITGRAAALGLLPPSRAAPAAMSTVTVPEAAGVIVAM